MAVISQRPAVCARGGGDGGSTSIIHVKVVPQTVSTQAVATSTPASGIGDNSIQSGADTSSQSFHSLETHQLSTIDTVLG